MIEPFFSKTQILFTFLVGTIEKKIDDRTCESHDSCLLTSGDFKGQSPLGRNLLLMHSYQEPKNPRESYPSARRQEPQAGAGQANGPALLRFG